MIACRGKSMYRLKAKQKPIQNGYQMFSLSDSGYVIDFLFHSVEKVHGEYPSVSYYFGTSKSLNPGLICTILKYRRNR